MEKKDFTLTKDQQKAFDLMMNGEGICVTGKAGTGKSVLIKTFRKAISRSKVIAITAMTGIAALHIEGATLHSYLGIGLGQGSADSLVEKIRASRFLLKRWEKLEVLCIDEVSMLSPLLFDKLETIARIVRNDDRPFGGIQIIPTGDFLQLPCVDCDQFCFEAKTWDKCVPYLVQLDEIIRQENKAFQQCLNDVRIGYLPPQTRELLESRVGVLLSNPLGIKPTKIYTTNKEVDFINEKELDLLAADGRDFYEYTMKTSIYGVGNKDYIAQKYKKLNIAPETIQLCVDAQVMLIYNLDFDNGLVNGSRGVVISFLEEYPVVRFINGIERVIDYHTWDIKENDQKIMQITQVPLKLGYAFTTHKSQGTTLDYAEINLGNIFEYGQAYVALSRVRDINGLSITELDFDRIKAHPKAIEFYKDLSQ